MTYHGDICLKIIITNVNMKIYFVKINKKHQQKKKKKIFLIDSKSSRYIITIFTKKKSILKKNIHNCIDILEEQLCDTIMEIHINSARYVDNRCEKEKIHAI